jgi:hypothetical protein
MFYINTVEDCSHWRSSQQEQKNSPCTNGSPHPRIPARRHIFVLASCVHTPPKETGWDDTPQLLQSPAYWPSVLFVQRTLIIDHSGIFDTPCIENIHILCIANSTNSSLMPSTLAYTPMFHCCNSPTVQTMVVFNVTYFAMTVYQLILLIRGRVHPSSPGPTPQPPRGGTSLWLPLATTPPKKMGVKMHRTPSCVHLKWKYNIRLPPKKRPSRAKATRLQVVNMLGWIWKSAIACFKAWSNQRATYYIYSGSWFVARFYCLRFHLLLWCLICTF